MHSAVPGHISDQPRHETTALTRQQAMSDIHFLFGAQRDERRLSSTCGTHDWYDHVCGPVGMLA